MAKARKPGAKKRNSRNELKNSRRIIENLRVLKRLRKLLEK